jgi:hypothetical protein
MNENLGGSMAADEGAIAAQATQKKLEQALAAAQAEADRKLKDAQKKTELVR